MPRAPHTAEELKDMQLHYNGFQEGFGSAPGVHLYTRLRAPQTTFAVHQGQSLADAHSLSLMLFTEVSRAERAAIMDINEYLTCVDELCR